MLPQAEKKRLDTLFDRIRYSAVSGIILFQPKEILSFLHSYARWKIAFDADDLAVVADRVRQIRPWNGGLRGVHTSINIIHCLAILISRNTGGLRGLTKDAPTHRSVTTGRQILDDVMSSVQAEVQKNSLEVSCVSKLVESMQLLKAPRPKGVLDAFRNVMIYRKKDEWENHHRNVLLPR